MTLIKICGIRDSETAEYAIQQGAQYIGLIFHPSSKRVVTIPQAKVIAAAVLKMGASPVAVVVDQTAEEVKNICEATGIKIVQLHGERVKAQQQKLPQEWQRIYVNSVFENGTMESQLSTENLNPERDFLLFDGVHAGSGQTFDWNNFKYNGNFRWFLSGGLVPNNIEQAIMQLKPNGVDVSSGVEDAQGNKDKKLIREFIQRAMQI